MLSHLPVARISLFSIKRQEVLMTNKRPPIRIRFKYNVDTGEIEEFIIDDNAATASETYHDKVAHAIARRLGNNPVIDDAGPVRNWETPPTPVETLTEEEKAEEREAEKIGE
jgi:hypothetical protein